MASKRLFELLVIEGQLKTQAEKTRKDLATTFEKKRHLFEEKLKSFMPSEENARAVIEEQSTIQSTVTSELRWLAGIWTKAMDTSYQVAHGNQHASADVVLDNGDTLLSNVPATALLELEKRASELQEVIAAIPTLDPAKGFTLDPDKGRNIYKAREVRKTRTRKVQKPIVLYDATKEHPAQVQLVSVDEPGGQITEQEWSGLITPAQKADMLERVEELRRAFKSALHRANAYPSLTDDQVCGQKIFDYVFGT